MTFSLTLFLDFSFLMIVLFHSLEYLLNKEPKRDLQVFSICFFRNSVFIIIFAYYLYDLSFPNLVIFNAKNVFYILCSSIICLAADFGYYFLKYKNIRIQKLDTSNKIILFLVVFFIPLIEELTYRVILRNVLLGFTDNNVIYVILSALGFSLNHLVYGKNNVVTKFIWGVVLSVSYLLTDSFLVPLITHLTCNIVICLYGYKNKR